MSHAATKWAFDQPEVHRDMKPSEWAVLMVLADCHNPVNGCFPSQDYICSKTNLGERAVRDQLSKLRDRRLVAWEAARENGKRGSNRYHLAFESDFQPAESAGCSTGEIEQEQPADSDTFNRQNLPPNPVREPVIEPVTPERETRARAEDPKPEDDADFQTLLAKVARTRGPQPTGRCFPLWLRLEPPERVAAVAGYDQAFASWHDAGQTKSYGLETYLRDRMWTQLPARPEGDPVMTLVRPRTDEWAALFFRRRKAGERVRPMLDAAKTDTGWGCPVSLLPTAEEIAAMTEIETGSAPFRAWVDELAREGLRLGGQACGRFIRVPSEYPPGWVHDPPGAEERGSEELETAEGERAQQ